MVRWPEEPVSAAGMTQGAWESPSGLPAANKHARTISEPVHLADEGKGGLCCPWSLWPRGGCRDPGVPAPGGVPCLGLLGTQASGIPLAQGCESSATPVTSDPVPNTCQAVPGVQSTSSSTKSAHWPQAGERCCGHFTDQGIEAQRG